MKPVVFSTHALHQLRERGASRVEVLQTIAEGTREPARKGRSQYRHNFAYNGIWAGRWYAVKQVAPVVVEEPDRFVVVTVYTFYF